eukprot:4999249-Amphidinium_carterae.1
MLSQLGLAPEAIESLQEAIRAEVEARVQAAVAVQQQQQAAGAAQQQQQLQELGGLLSSTEREGSHSKVMMDTKIGKPDPFTGRPETWDDFDFKL